MSKQANLAAASTIIQRAAEGLPEVNVSLITQRVERGLLETMTQKEIENSVIMEARPLIETNPIYSVFAAKILSLATTAQMCHDVNDLFASTVSYPEDSSSAFIKSLQVGKALDMFNCDPFELFNVKELHDVIEEARRNVLINDYLGFQTLYDRYFLRHRDWLLEDYYTFYMRVVMGHAINEDRKANTHQQATGYRTAAAVQFFFTYVEQNYSSSTPSLFNGMLKNSQMSSCYLSTIPDSLHGIYKGITDNALLSKFAGGLGNDWTPVRALGSWIKGTNGKSQGTIPFLKVANDTAVAVNQGGKRKGAVCAYLETWHLDIEEFLDLRKNTGDDRRRTHDMNTANWIPDLFMERVFDKEALWTLFSPSDTTDLHDLYGNDFRHAYEAYEAQIAAGTYSGIYKQLRAIDLWRKMLGMVFETGHPWITFKDPCNIRSPQTHCGVVHSSNLCTEITLNTKAEDEIAVCNLGSINVANHTTKKGLDFVKLKATVRTAVRMLDNVIDVNFYPVPAAAKSNFRHRPIGLGIMGLQDALYIQGFAYDSDEAIEFSDQLMEAISYYAIEMSAELAIERGSYESFEGSTWSKGILPIDTIELLKKSRNIECTMDESTGRVPGLDWDLLRSKAKRGMRNSNLMAIAPTATISNINGVTQSIEPTYQNLFVKSNLSGEFTVINTHLFNKLTELDLWDQDMVDYLKVNEGSVQGHPLIPQDVKDLFKTAFEVNPFAAIKAASRRQKWIDQSQSLNLYIMGANGKLLDQVYKAAWTEGLKTTYYLRALAATTTEKSTVNNSALNKVSSGA